MYNKLTQTTCTRNAILSFQWNFLEFIIFLIFTSDNLHSSLSNRNKMLKYWQLDTQAFTFSIQNMCWSMNLCISTVTCSVCCQPALCKYDYFIQQNPKKAWTELITQKCFFGAKMPHCLVHILDKILIDNHLLHWYLKKPQKILVLFIFVGQLFVLTF